MAEWTSPLPWLPHERGLARWAAKRWTGAGDWPAALALLAAAEDEGHTALDWDRAEEVWNRRFANEIPVPRFDLPPPENWPRALFDEGWLRLVRGRVVQTAARHALETRLLADLTALAEGSTFAPETGQDAAVARAGRTRLLILVGGPGTGKTTTLKRLLAAWNQARPGVRAVVTAPTGRAAARAAEAFGADTVPTLTVHRLLGLRPGLGEPRHGPERPLAFDLVIVDEASMLDLRTAAALTAALPEGAALALVGDPGQLPSVEAGSVLSSLLDRPEFASSTVRLTRRYRLEERSRSLAAAFDLLASAPAADDVETLQALAREGRDFRWEITPDGDTGRRAVEVWGPRAATLATLNESILLSPVYDGPGGVRELGALAERALGRVPGMAAHGTPWLITRNLAQLGLANGDRGVLLQTNDGLYFEAPGTRPWPFPMVAADGQPAWAVTVHKSQGSEFDRVVLALPPRDSFVSRELIYTGLTRAKSSAVLVASVEAVRAALARRMDRMSGW